MNIIRMAREAIRRIVAAPSSAEVEAEAFRKGVEAGWAERLEQERNNTAVAAFRLVRERGMKIGRPHSCQSCTARFEISQDQLAWIAGRPDTVCLYCPECGSAHSFDEAEALRTAVKKHLKWFERFICDRDELDSSTPRKVAQAAQEAAEDLRAALGLQQ